MPPSLRRSTLFPYTTLFRSSGYEFRGFIQKAPKEKGKEGEKIPTGVFQQKDYAWNTPVGIFSDRKSTRLNSSHLGISYAVFCLKKKMLRLRHSRDCANSTFR